ncbi:uncharacterized protein C16orf96 homolog [Pezoporus wallicus]|uniref:uncharacterized protein C16orf96 homolog n=1 Tax=Pezoporus wallicus TaxID=35540 RepID=UPI00254B98A8|nr:uncharacterized protein C16orf96 homolog [Pezoporus wallicus]XP_061329976.1 uncharacterized protein C16orf96 homolog [Pezoporus flaviventris]
MVQTEALSGFGRTLRHFVAAADNGKAQSKSRACLPGPYLSSARRTVQGSCVCPLRSQCPHAPVGPAITRPPRPTRAWGHGAHSLPRPTPPPPGPDPHHGLAGTHLPAAASQLLLRHPQAPGRGGERRGGQRAVPGRIGAVLNPPRAGACFSRGAARGRGRSLQPPAERGLLPCARPHRAKPAPSARPHRDGAWSRRSPPARLAQDGDRTPGPSPGNVLRDLIPGIPPAATARGPPRATEGNMTLTITLADVASSVTNGGSTQVGRLCVLLPGPPEHIQLQEGGQDEAGLYQPPLRRPGGTLDTAGPAEQQMAQMKRRIEVTEASMTKVMDMLQEVLTTICSLKTTIEGFEEELHLLKDNFHKASLEEMQERSVQQDKYSHILQSILDQLVEVRQELCRSSLCRMPAGEKPSSWELSPEASQELGQEASCRLSWMLEQHETVETHGLDFGREVLGQVRQLQKQCMRLQEAAERLWGDTKDTQKADKAALKTKVSQEELQHAMVQLSEMMQDLLQRMSQMDQDTQNALEKLLNEMDSKLDHVALAPLQAQLEQVRGLIQQCLCQGPCNDGRAAGFKRQLSGPAKCISCNRPLAMAPAPPLVTIRKTSQFLQPQPASTSNCLVQQLLERASQRPGSSARPLSTSTSLITVCPCRHPADFICNNREVDILGIDGVIYKGRLNSLGTNRTATMGKDFPCRGSALGQRMSSGQAVQSHERPTVSTWDGAVPVCGKSISSLSSPCASSVSASHLETVKNPQARTRHTTEKMVSIPKYGSHYVSPYSRAAMQMKTSSSGGHWQTAMGSSWTSGV